jgi:hypothetical protein
MPVKSFKFVSPGVFINEIDNSFRPRRPDAIGPVVIGRSVRGLAMQPVKVESFSDFLTMYGDTVPGAAGGDVYRDGNYQSPMYGTYAAKAFLNASVAPVTYMRLLGVENDNKETGGEAGWKTTAGAVFSGAPGDSRTNGGAYGLWAFPDATLVQATATLTFDGSTVAPGKIITIISSDGTSVAYTAGSGTNVATNTFKGDGSAVENAGSLKLCMDAAQGHNGKIVVSDDGAGVLTLTQTLAGSEGNAAMSTNANGTSLVITANFSGGTSDIGSGTLSAVWYLDQSSSIQLSGNLPSTANYTDAAGDPIIDRAAQGVGIVVESDSAGNFTAFMSGSKASSGANEKFVFNFDDTDQRFIRKVFNTNPQLVSSGDFYDSTLERNYWLGGTFEQELRDGGRNSLTGSSTSLVASKMLGVILPIEKGGVGPGDMQVGTQEAQTGWFIGQDLGAAGSYLPEEALKLFKLKGRGHGEWLNKNVKISIEKIRYSNTQTSDFGSFSVVLRSLTDTDSSPVVLERFDNLSLDPRSPDYISRRIGDKYLQWSETERRLREYGEYPNQSKFVYVSDINEGNIQNANSLVPFGYYGPAPRVTLTLLFLQSTSLLVSPLERVLVKSHQLQP